MVLVAHLLSLGLSSCVEMSIGLSSLYGGEEDVVYYYADVLILPRVFKFNLNVIGCG